MSKTAVVKAPDDYGKGKRRKQQLVDNVNSIQKLKNEHKCSSVSTSKKPKILQEIHKKPPRPTTQMKSYRKEIDPETNKEQDASEIELTAKLPTRNKKGQLVFEDFPEFHPNLTPKEVIQAGSFGGTYFRPIKSAVTGNSYSRVWTELPKDWLEGLCIQTQVMSSVYDEKVNKYQVKCGTSLEMWEHSGWIHKQDPYGWFQWYCRFYQGRRTADDNRQIGRWLRCAGPQGRWRINIITKCIRSGSSYDDHAVSPVVRQTLQHWAYRLTKEDFELSASKIKLKRLL